MRSRTPQEALRHHVSGAIARREKALSVPDKHRLRIARDSVRAPCAMLGVTGGPNHSQARNIIHQLTGQIVGIDADCTCN